MRNSSGVRATGRRQQVDSRLVRQLGVFMIIFTIMVALVAIHTVTEDLAVLPILAGFLAGCLVGTLLVRTKVLSWDASEQRVVGTMDAVGAIILVVYLLVFVLNKGAIASHWISNPQELAAIGLALTAGVMLGRTVFTIRAIRDILGKAGMAP